MIFPYPSYLPWSVSPSIKSKINLLYPLNHEAEQACTYFIYWLVKVTILIKENKMRSVQITFAFGFILFLGVLGAEDKGTVEMKVEEPSVDVSQERLEYAKGSVCSYCEYCKFCKLCAQDCPCETSPAKPNCKMCKYCKYCNLCSAVCDTVCTPGGILDRVTGAIVNSLPSFDKKEVDGDINSVKTWIDQKRDEL